MTNYVGGLRLRLIKDSLYYMLNSSMDQLGWFNSGLTTKPVILTPEQLDTSVEIKPNIVGISSENMIQQDIELGSNLAENTWDIYIDVLAEDEAVGIHLAGDIYDILRGKISSIGRTKPRLEVYDLYPNNNDIIFNCQFENVILHRVRDWSKPANKYWWVIGVEIIDTYYDDQV